MPAQSSAPTISLRDWSLLVLLSLLWGATFVFIRVAQVQVPPVTIVLCRVMVGALVLLAVLRLSRIAIPVSRGTWMAFFGMGLLNNVVPFSLISWGEARMPLDIAVSLPSILNSTTPLFTMVVAHLLTHDDRLTIAKIIGLVLGFGGVVVMLAPRIVGAAHLTSDNGVILGTFACLLASLVYGFSALYARRFKTMGLAPLQIAFGQLAASSLMMVPISSVIDRPWTLPFPNGSVIAALLGLGVFSTGIAYILFFRILATAGPSNLTLVTFLIPVSAIGLGIALFGEHLDFVHVIGMVLIALGLAAIDGRTWQMLRHQKHPP